MSNVPAELLYTSDHEWVSPLSAEGTVRVGITDHAQDALGDVVYVDLPSVGDSLDAEGSFGEIESTKSVSDLLSPVAGEVVAVNEAVRMRMREVPSSNTSSGARRASAMPVPRL